MKAAIDGGALGTPVFASGRVKWYRPPEYYGDSRWRGTWRLDGGGVLMNQAIHTLDTLLWLFGPVGARVGPRRDPAPRDRSRGHGGRPARVRRAARFGVLEASTAAFPGFPRRIEVTGTEGHARARAGRARPRVVADASGHQRVIEDFFDRHRDRRHPGLRRARRAPQRRAHRSHLPFRPHRRIGDTDDEPHTPTRLAAGRLHGRRRRPARRSRSRNRRPAATSSSTTPTSRRTSRARTTAAARPIGYSFFRRCRT